MVKNDIKTVDEYIQSFPKKTQVHLKSIRAAIKSSKIKGARMG